MKWPPPGWRTGIWWVPGPPRATRSGTIPPRGGHCANNNDALPEPAWRQIERRVPCWRLLSGRWSDMRYLVSPELISEHSQESASDCGAATLAAAHSRNTQVVARVRCLADQPFDQSRTYNFVPHPAVAYARRLRLSFGTPLPVCAGLGVLKLHRSEVSKY
jgi:hypothetical protein